MKTGNPADSIDDPWIDYGRFGVRDARELDERLLDLLFRLDLGDDLYRSASAPSARWSTIPRRASA